MSTPFAASPRLVVSSSVSTSRRCRVRWVLPLTRTTSATLAALAKVVSLRRCLRALSSVLCLRLSSPIDFRVGTLYKLPRSFGLLALSCRPPPTALLSSVLVVLLAGTPSVSVPLSFQFTKPRSRPKKSEVEWCRCNNGYVNLWYRIKLNLIPGRLLPGVS